MSRIALAYNIVVLLELILLLYRKAFHEYFIEERFEAGMVLQGWEVKGIRAGRAQLKESYVVILAGELWLLGMHISPLYRHPPTPCPTPPARANCCSKPTRLPN